VIVRTYDRVITLKAENSS